MPHRNERVYALKDHVYATLDNEYNMLMSAMEISVSKHILDDEFTVVWANDFYYSRTGYTKEEYESLFHNSVSRYYQNDLDEYEKIGKSLIEALENGKSGYTVLSRMPVKGGKYIWIKVVGTFTDEFIDGKPIIYSTFTDITEIIDIKTAQSVTFNNIPGFVAKFKVKPDMKFEFIEANEKFVQFFGERGPDDKPYCIVNCHDEKNRKIVESYYDKMRKGESISFTVQDKDKYGNDAYLKINAECIDKRGGDPIYLFVYIDITDVTEQKALREKLEKQSVILKSALESAEKANRAKSDFLSRMSHDIRTPMNAILGMTQISMNCLDDPERIKSCLTNLEVSARFLLSLINDILDMSKIESGKITLNKREIDFAALMRDLASMFVSDAGKRDIDFYIGVNGILREKYFGDELKLKQILINLLGNSLKFTPAGGHVKCIAKEEIATENSCKITFTVSDDGIGMDESFISRVFDPFEQNADQNKFGGSGLGLAIAQSFAKMMNGNIEVESRKDKGSVFKVSIWLDKVDCNVQFNDFGDVNAVVVENVDVPGMEYTQKLIEKFNIHGTVCTDADGALEALEKSVSDFRYNLVVTSWGIAGVDGEEVVRRVREKYNNGEKVVIIAVNAFDVGAVEADAKTAGADIVVSRPMFPSAVNDLLVTITDGSGNAKKRPVETSDNVGFDNQTVLLVEDNDINMEIAKIFLANVDLKTESARNGKEAVELFLSRPEDYYSAILMDIQMPVMDGYKATAAIRGSDKADAQNIPIIAMSANAFDEDVQKSLDSGMNAHVSKPVDVKELYSVLRANMK